MMAQIQFEDLVGYNMWYLNVRYPIDSTQNYFYFNSRFYKSDYISAVPILVILILSVIYCLSSILKRLFSLKWMRNIIENDDKDMALSCSPKISILLLLSFMGFVVQSIGIIYPKFQFTMVLPTISWVFTSLIILKRCKKAILLFLPIVFVSISITQAIIIVNDRPHQFHFMSAILLFFPVIFSSGSIVVILSMPIRNFDRLETEISPAFSTPNADFRSPEDNLTVWQFMTVSWMAPLIFLGKIKQLNDKDVWSLGYEFKHCLLFEKFRVLKGSVLEKLLMANGLDLCIVSVLGIIELIANFLSPLLLGKILQSIEVLSSTKDTVIYAFLMLVARCVAAQSSVFSLWYSRRVYERSRGEMIIMLYEKTLSRKIRVGNIKINEKLDLKSSTIINGNFTNTRNSLIFRIKNYCAKSVKQLFCCRRADKHSKKENLASSGKILNLMRFDAYEVSQRFWEFSSIITQPLGLIFSVILIWNLLGWPCLLGVTTIFLAQIFNALLARILLKWERKRKIATDIKLQHITQFVEAIRHLRYFAWQNVWLKSIMDARQRELGLRIITGLWRILINFFNTLASGFFPVVAFWAYSVLIKKPLRVNVVFPALQLFSMLESSLRGLPNLIMALLNATVSLERLDNFMLEPDVQDLSIPTGSKIKLQNASFAWPDTDKPVLSNLNLSFEPGINMICGEVGAGKSALLLALLGELDQLEGEYLRYRDMIGYCGQIPWLQSMSIRDNILFSAPYEEIRYKNVLESCALIPDLESFKYGDLSMIGENGIGLSGGQKARISLARAVYSQANILLLDDPLSSLDYQTAEFVMQRCLSSPIVKGRTVILVTHRTELCSEIATQIIYICAGKASLINAADLHSDLNFKNEYIESNSVKPIQSKNGSHDQNSVPDKFMEDEYRAYGGVQNKVYWEYVKAGRLKWWFILICVLALFRLTEIGETWFLKQWSEAYGKLKIQGLSYLRYPFRSLPSPETNILPWLVGFSLLTIAEALSYIVSQGIMLIIIYKAGKTLFENVMAKVTHAKFRFYDITPVGRLMNRLTSDINTVDGNISNQFHDVAILFISWLFSLITIGFITPLFLIFALGLSSAFILIFLHFLPTSQSLRRLEMVSLTPLISNFGAVTDGLTTIRAYCATSRFLDRVIAVTDNFQKMDHFYWSLQSWLMYRFDILSALFTFSLTILALYMGISAGLVAFVLTASSRFVTATHSLCRKYGQLQMDFVSIERVVELLNIPQEEKGKFIPPASWPHYGSDIILENVNVQYAPHLDMVLSDISLKIPGGSTTALTGRTGCGKSTLALALLGILPPTSGRIIVDGLDLATIDLEILRSRISFLAQEPVLFPGTLKQNLDPLSQYSLDECEAVISAISAIHNYAWSLDTPIDARGGNLSQGQRQLVGLARVLLRRSPIVILDEATASLDFHMAEQIQILLREWITQSTILVVAHRPEAVRDANIIVRMAKGKILEVREAI
ncbi:ATP-dependent bile acid permease [Erysiphe neolycopersici]|uniref:ATP-dependent bile acid permease n=1 Tax=Erysiphe neolycopersici TaxID=212602 RepID=A0A420HPF5_9PEZI|nr:ATP-dependent bile acid permease [Erysiphe neolycopersici]